MQILLADDHALFRDAVSAWLDRLGEQVSISVASSLEGVLSLLEQGTGFDLVLLDLDMPGMEGTASIRQVCAAAAGAPVVIVSATEAPDMIRDGLAAGAVAYVPKSSSGHELLASLRRVLPASNDTDTPGLAALSDKQRHILALLGEGASNRTIAERLHLSEGTVKQYVSEILRRLGVENRTQAGLQARQLLEGGRD